MTVGGQGEAESAWGGLLEGLEHNQCGRSQSGCGQRAQQRAGPRAHQASEVILEETDLYLTAKEATGG